MKKTSIGSELYRWLAGLGKVAGALTFLFGIPYGVSQYLARQQDARISQTLELFKEFNTAPFSSYRTNITKAVIGNNAVIADASLKGPDALQSAILNIVDKAGIETDLVMTMDFFDALYTCIDQNLCDPDMSQRLFSPRARELFKTFYQYIEQRRNSAGADYGIGLQLVAQMKPR